MVKRSLESMNIPKIFKEDISRTVIKMVNYKSSILQIILFGSCSREKVTEGSDIDICIVTEFDDSERDELENFFTCDVFENLGTSQPLAHDVILITPQQFKDNSENRLSIIPNIIREGVILYG